MTKKSHGGRSATVARRPVSTAAKVALVRASVEEQEGPSAPRAATVVAPAANDRRPTSLKNAPASKSGPVAPAARPAPPPTSAAQRAKVQRAMKAAGQTTTKRTLIRAENYTYVKRDLALIGVVAVLMFAFMIVLHFVLPS